MFLFSRTNVTSRNSDSRRNVSRSVLDTLHFVPLLELTNIVSPWLESIRGLCVSTQLDMIPAGNIDYLDSLAFLTASTQLSKSNFRFSKSLG